MDAVSLVILCLVTVVFVVILWFKWRFTYWKRKGVPYIEPEFPFGTSVNPLTRKEYIGVRIKKQYEEFKSNGHKHGGLYKFAKPTYMPIDPDYLKNIMSKDFQYFTDRGVYYNEKDDPLSAHLFAIEGQKWRNLRTKLTPTFTSGKMKTMFHTLLACANQLTQATNVFAETKKPVDIKDLLACFTIDVIGSCAFGLECNSFKDEDSEFRKYGKLIFSPVTRLQAVRNAVAFANPKLGRFLGITLTNPQVSKFFLTAVKDTIEYRKINNYVRDDFLQILIDLKKNKDKNPKSSSDGLTSEEIAAQAYVFFFGGYETSSTTMTFCLYELSMHPEIQDKLRKEINRTFKKCNQNLTYDGLMDMKYMGQVIDETLRKYPPAPLIPRRCIKDYQIPGTDIVIDKGMRVTIPVLGLHHDADYYPEPDVFDPERFNDENKQSIRPYTYMPFGEGPRICIGLRFGLMQTKIGLAFLLKHFKFSLNKRTNNPLVMNPFIFILTAKGGIWLDVAKI